MRGTAYYCTVEELQKRGRDDIPEQFRSNTHSDLQFSGDACVQLAGSGRIRCEKGRACNSGFDHADRGTGMLWAEYIHD